MIIFSTAQARILAALLAIAIDIGSARFTYSIALEAMRAELHFGFAVSGLLNSIHLTGYLLGNLLLSRMTRNIRLDSLFRISHVAMGCFCVTSAISIDSITLGASRFFMGVAAAFGVSSAVANVLADTPSSRRMFVSNVIWAGPGIAIIAAGLFAFQLQTSQAGWRIAHWVTAGTAFLLAACYPQAVSAADKTPSAAPQLPNVVAERVPMRLLSSAYLAFGAAYVAYTTFASSQLSSLHASRAQISTFWIAMGAALIAGAAACAPALRHDRWRSTLLPLIMLVGAAGAAIAQFAGLTWLVVASCAVGIGLATTPAIVTALLRQRTTSIGYLNAFGKVTALLAVGHIVGPALAGLTAERIGSAAIVPLLSAFLYGLAAVLAWLDARLNAGYFNARTVP
jgi:predicted MFS family arabinose efflux permease